MASHQISEGCAATGDDVAISGSDQIANTAIHLVLCHPPGVEPLTEMLQDDAIAARLGPVLKGSLIAL